MRNITLLLFVSMKFSLCVFSVCSADGTGDETSHAKARHSFDNIKDDLETYRKELREYKKAQEALQKVVSEDNNKLREAMEVLDRFSAKSISFASYTLTGIALVLSLVNAFFV